MTTNNTTTNNTSIKTSSFISTKGTPWRCIDKTARIYGLTIQGTATSISGQKQYRTIDIRIDGRSREGYRVDSSCMLNYAWEAIDNGHHFRTLKDAKAFAKRWLRASYGERVPL